MSRTRKLRKRSARFRVAVGDAPPDGGYVIGKKQAQEIGERFQFRDNYPLHQKLDDCLCGYKAWRAYNPPSKSAGAETAAQQEKSFSDGADAFKRSLDWLKNTNQRELEAVGEKMKQHGEIGIRWYSHALTLLAALSTSISEVHDEHRASMTLGRPSDEPLTLLLQDLRNIWIEGTGRPATVSNNASEYGGQYFDFIKNMINVAGVRLVSDSALVRQLYRLIDKKPR